MKQHFNSLFGPKKRWITISILLISVACIIGSQIVGITDNLPGIAMLSGGIVLLFFAFLHIWRKAKNYVILMLSSFAIIILMFLIIYILAALHKTEFISEGIVMGMAGLICIPGIITGIFGSVYWAFKNN